MIYRSPHKIEYKHTKMSEKRLIRKLRGLAISYGQWISHIVLPYGDKRRKEKHVNFLADELYLLRQFEEANKDKYILAKITSNSNAESISQCMAIQKVNNYKYVYQSDRHVVSTIVVGEGDVYHYDYDIFNIYILFKKR